MFSIQKNQVRGALLFTMLALSLPGCNLPGGGGGGPPTPATGNSSTLTGTVWHDLCAAPELGSIPDPPPEGCILLGGGGLEANGIYEPGEPGIAGVQMLLGNGSCSAQGSTSSEFTVADGSFQFEIPPPTAGTYCLSIDPLSPPNDSILIPGGFTNPSSGQIEFTLSQGEDLSDLNFGWDYQFLPTYEMPNLVITNVMLDTTTPQAGGWVGVEVTIENQGGAVATGFELVLIPHYGWGPPNPAGYEVLPDLAPGAIHTVTFSPGVLYSSVGTFTLRVLVTDDWYATGNPDSTGTAGDYQDFLITVSTPPTFTPSPTPIPPTLTPTITILPWGVINGMVWKDSNNDGVRQNNEAGYSGVTVLLGLGPCTSSGYRSTVTDSLGGYFFQDLPAGTYCVFPDITPACETYSIASTPSERTVVLAPGQALSFIFGYAPYVC